LFFIVLDTNIIFFTVFNVMCSCCFVVAGPVWKATLCNVDTAFLH